MAVKLTKRVVDALKPGNRDRFAWDSEIKGFGVKVTTTGHKVFLFVYRFPRGRKGKVKRFTIGTYGNVTADTARDTAKKLAGMVTDKKDPMAALQADRVEAEAERRAPRKSVEKIAGDFIEKHHKRQNRTWHEAKRLIDRHIVPAWKHRQIGSITRGEVNELLDEIEEAAGATTAHAVLKQIRKMFNWYAIADERFSSPLVPRMSRITPAQQRRTRTLSDPELRTVWQALNASPTPFRQLVRFLLLTAQRRTEASSAQRSDIDGDLWTIPPERYKTNKVHLVPLSQFALQQIEDLGDHGKLGAFQFTTTGDKPFQGFGKAKAKLDAEIERILRKALPKGEKRRKGPLMPHWQIHDLRRTAKTLMQRAKVRPDISERVLGHVIPGVAGTYDQHEYFEEKREALELLAEEVRRIIT
jgi:integrase